MLLRCLETGEWSVVEEATSADLSPITSALERVAPDRKADIAGMLVLFERAASNGPRSLPSTLCHEVGQGIWEFSKGVVRVLFFEADGRLVLCSHAFRKKTQKAPRKEVDKAVRLRDRYIADRQAGNVKIK